jgi:N6-adenosine-specific RNA methylase IME4
LLKASVKAKAILSPLGNRLSSTKRPISSSTNLFPRTDHSRKPEEFFAIANRLGDVWRGSEIELFAREVREGWDAWGAEVEENLEGVI